LKTLEGALKNLHCTFIFSVSVKTSPLARISHQ
jgi:hypothetical protein